MPPPSSSYLAPESPKILPAETTTSTATSEDIWKEEVLPTNIWLGKYNSVDPGKGALELLRKKEMLFPYTLQGTYDSKPLQCGFYPGLHAGGWRLAYCMEGVLPENPAMEGLTPVKLYLYETYNYTKTHIIIGPKDFGYFTREAQ